MSIQVISITHKRVPLNIREKFSFSREQQEEIMRKATDCLEILECVLLSTCNRTEMYVYADSSNTRLVFNRMEDVLFEEADIDTENEDVGDYLLFYQDDAAIHHLFQVAAGLDSMVIGEDQILGQVKEAHKYGREAGTTAVFLNTFFRDAVTAAKRVKTDTELSKTSVSTATLAIKVAEEELGNLRGRKVMVIGASGKIGGIVIMNLQSLEGVDLYVTLRKNKVVGSKHSKSGFDTVDYEDRYKILDDMDVVISATGSPHYTLTYNKMVKHLPTQKPRVFVDLAVPMDIDKKIGLLPETAYYNIDDMNQIAMENNRKKQAEAKMADRMLDDYEKQFKQWMIFQKSLPIMRKVKQNFLEVADKKGTDKAFDHLFYWIRENNEPENLETFFRCLKN